MLSERPGPEAPGSCSPAGRWSEPSTSTVLPGEQVAAVGEGRGGALGQALVQLRADEEQHHREQHPGHGGQHDPLDRALDPEGAPARRRVGRPPLALADQPLPAVAGRAEAVAQPPPRLVDLVFGLGRLLGAAAVLGRWAEFGRAARISVRHQVVYSVRACRHGASSVSTPGAPSCSAASWTRRWRCITGCTGGSSGSIRESCSTPSWTPWRRRARWRPTRRWWASGSPRWCGPAPAR